MNIFILDFEISKIRYSDEILDECGDFGWTKNVILAKIFMSAYSQPQQLKQDCYSLVFVQQSSLLTHNTLSLSAAM